jgi:CRP-like cAMP-binding protein
MQTASALELAQYRSHLKKFVVFTDEEWEVFTPHLYRRSIPKKEVIISGDKTCNEIGFILKGACRFYLVKDGVEISNYFCFQNELISSYGSFLKRQPGGITIEAMEDTDLICLSYASLQTLIADERIMYKMERFGRMVAEYLILCYEERVLSFLTQSPEQRYLQLLEQQPAFLQLIPQHYLANYLGVTPVSLSRIRKRIFAAGHRNKMAS